MSFTPPSPAHEADNKKLDHHLHVRESRLAFTPLYVIVGAYRLCSDEKLYVPVWDKCRHGVVRGAVVGAVWGVLTYKIQKTFVELFLRNSPRVTGLSTDTLFGFQLPFTLTTYASLLLLASQLTTILTFFLSRNLRIARDRAWEQTLRSRGKGQEFWGPYVEEWTRPPVVSKEGKWEKMMSGWVGRVVVRRIAVMAFSFYPVVGIGISAYIKALGTAKHLHKAYFEAKKMTPAQVAVFMEERKWHYQAFGFTAALLEGLPIIGIAFSISNRVGAAMWAYDLEKRQHAVAAGELSLVEPIAGRGGDDGVAMAGGWGGVEKVE